MANKKLIYNSEDGRIKEISSGSGNSSTYYDDSSNKLYAKNITFNTMSVDTVHGIPVIYNQTMSVISVSNGDILSWDNSGNTWKTVTSSYIDITANTASANADVSGSFNDIKIKSLSNVRSGSSLPVANGGTGLSLSDYSSLSGEAILVGNGTSKFTFLTASSDTSSTNNISTDGTRWLYLTGAAVTSSIDVQVFTSSATWTKPSGTKFIRVLAQGAGGGGGSGANRAAAASTVRCGGGAGGSSGGFIDKTYTVGVNDTNFIVTVGTGGAGGVTPSTGNAGNAGLAGGSSSFGTSSITFFIANGGNGGAGGAYNTVAVSAGGTAVTGTYNVWETVTYGPLNVGATSIAGGSGSATSGQSVTFSTSSTTYYISAGGGGGGSVSGSTPYSGGNGGTSNFNSGSTSAKDAGNAVSSSVTGALGLVSSNFANNSQFNNIFIACGGGGGAGSNSAIGGLGGSGSWGSGGGGGGGSQDATPGITQGGRGGDGYVVVISYK